MNSTLKDNVEDLYIVMPMYNLLEYNQNYSMASGSLWSYYRDKIDDVDENASDGDSFKYKTKIVGKTPRRLPRPPKPPPNSDGSQPPKPEQPAQAPVPALNVEVVIPLKDLSNFWRFLDLRVINCEIDIDLSWRKDCGFSEHHNNLTGATFQVNNAKICVPVVTFSMNDIIKFLENIEQGFKRTISWNK